MSRLPSPIETGPAQTHEAIDGVLSAAAIPTTEATANASLSERPHYTGPEITSKLVSIVGISTGDEGKGRAIPDLRRILVLMTGDPAPVSMVVKVNGGANSGHTIHDGAEKLKLNLLPGGVSDPTVSYLGLSRGVVADPLKLNWETVPLEAKGYAIRSRLQIDYRTMLSDVTDRLLDLAHEKARTRNGESRGSTGRGISPAFSHETDNTQIYYGLFADGDRTAFASAMIERMQTCCDLIQHVYKLTPDEWSELFTTLTTAEKRANADAIAAGQLPSSQFEFERFKGETPFTLNSSAIIEDYWEAGTKFAECVTDIGELSLAIMDQGKYILGEHGQAYWLDKRHGFAPNVTSSHTYTAELYQALDVPTQNRIHVVGAAKAYDTKVGNHVFLTQMDEMDPLYQVLAPLEFGVSTGRQRMVGHFDAVEKGSTLRHGGFDDLVINKLDALTYAGEWNGKLKICYAYEDAEGNRFSRVPQTDAIRRQLHAVYREYAGWSEDITAVRDFSDLPINAQRYVAGMYRSIVESAHQGRPRPWTLPTLRFIGVGPGPEQIICDMPPPEELMELENRLDMLLATQA